MTETVQEAAPVSTGDVVSTPTEHTSSAPVEKMVPQSEVNALIGRYKKESYEKGLREAQQQAPQQPTQQAATTFGGMPTITPDQVNSMIEQALQKKNEENALGQFVNQFTSKLAEGAKKYADYDQKVGQLDFKRLAELHPEVLLMANSAENTADIMYELANNPKKIMDISSLHKISPKHADQEMKSLAASIKANQVAANARTPNEPLSHVRPSPVSTDNGSKSISDLRQEPWLAG